MAIPNFFQQQQQSLQTGLGLGQAMVDAQQRAMFDPMKQQMMQGQVEAQGIQNQLGQQNIAGQGLRTQQAEANLARTQQQTESQKMDDFNIQARQDMAMLFNANQSDELFKKVYADIAPKYENVAGWGDFMDTLGSKDMHERNKGLLMMQGALNPDQKKGRSTSAIENQKHYNELKKTDPGAAELFAASAGLTTSGKKDARLFKVIENDDGSLTKIFSDGSEETGDPKKPIKTNDMKSSITMKQALNVLDKSRESQSKNGGFAINMRSGLNDLEKLDAKGFDAKDITFVQTFLAGKSLGNVVMTPDEQVYAGAIESIINSIARRESGAAIGEEETQRFFARYMPQAGDSKARMTQKRKSLETQFKSIRGQSGRVYDALRVTMGLNSDSPQQPVTAPAANQTAPQVGQVVDGWMFKGGDPSKPESWEQQ